MFKLKILTGDNEGNPSSLRKVGLDVDQILLGSDIDAMTGRRVGPRVEKVTVFAKLSGSKSTNHFTNQIEWTLYRLYGRWNQRCPSMKVADVGISVDTAVDIAKETADVILLDKDLMVLEKESG